MRPRTCAAAVLLALLLPAALAEAVIPSAFGPIQALLVILPQILLALAAAMLALFKPRTYRLLFAYLWSHKILALVLVGGLAFLIWGPSIGGAKAVAEEQTGVPWVAFRGGPERSGAVPGARGPAAPVEVAWKAVLGMPGWVDSSPAVVGNRVYVGVGNPSALGGEGTGIIACLDAETGQVAWQYEGRNLTPPLRPVFSSPAVWVEKGPDGAASARYVVSGEGYHDSKNCRLICLDLEKKKEPRLRWVLQTTSHVESTPCLFDGKAYIGAGDDGVWCVELETGKVLWRLEGTPFYEVTGPDAEALAKLEGRTVVATGTATRVGLGAQHQDDPGHLVLEVKSFKEHSGPAVTAIDSGATYERTVTGRVSKKDGRLRLEVGPHIADAESSPVGVMAGEEPRVLFGSGLDGSAVYCVNARTGAVLWKAPTPFPAFGAPAVSGERVLIGVGNGNFVRSAPNPAGAILCFSLKDGKELWRAAAADTVIGAVAVSAGRAYACSRDGNVYVLELEKGAVVAKIAVGAPMVTSPAVAGDAVYVSTNGGRVFSLDARAGTVRWSQGVAAGTEIFSSPAVSGGRIFVGSHGKGLFAIGERKAEQVANRPPKPWMGPGGDAGRTGCADDLGLPPIEGDTADLKWPTAKELSSPVVGPLSVRERSLEAPVAAGTFKVSLETGRCQERSDKTSAADASLRAFNLIFRAAESVLACASDVGGSELWSVPLGTPAAAPPCAAGDKVFVACAGRGKVKGYLEARRVLDGSLAWRQELDDAPLTYPVANESWIVVAMADDRIAVFRAADGKPRDHVVVGGPAVAPALWKDTLVVAGDERIAAYDLAAAAWAWKYKDEDKIGKATGQPVVAGRTVWVGTTKMGLVAIGIPPKP